MSTARSIKWFIAEMGVKTSGIDDVQVILKKKLGNARTMARVVAPVMVMGAEAMMTDAKLRVPVDTGALKSSGRVHRATISSARVVVVLGFHKSYALYVHEDLTARHPVGEAKFLEKAVTAGARNLERSLAAAIEKELKK